MDVGVFMLVAAWLSGPPREAEYYGIRAAEFIDRFETMEACVEVRERFRRGEYGGRYNPQITFHCIDLKKLTFWRERTAARRHATSAPPAFIATYRMTMCLSVHAIRKQREN